MLIRISETQVINIQQATGLYIAKKLNWYEVRCTMIDNEYVINLWRKPTRLRMG